MLSIRKDSPAYAVRRAKLLQINVEASLAWRTAVRRLNRLCGGLETALPQF